MYIWEIKITKVSIEESDGGIELIYIPDQTQTLYAGVEYKFILSINPEAD